MKLLRGSAGAMARWCGVARVVQRSGAGPLRTGSGLRERGRCGAREAGVAFKGGGRGSRRAGLGEIMGESRPVIRDAVA